MAGLVLNLPAYTSASSTSVTATNWTSWQDWVRVAAVSYCAHAHLAATSSTTTSSTDYVIPQTWLTQPHSRIQSGMTAEERQVRDQQARERQAASIAAEALANAKAEALLRAHLNPRQRDELEAHDWFIVVGKQGRYRVNRGRSANIDVLNSTGQTTHSLCAHPRELVPDADTMLAQKFMLEHDEAGFLQMANNHPVNHHFRRAPRPAQPAALVAP